ncbi:zinc-binding alcohol dehydrogenase family protein [Vitiosangium sp. GDMCC 1.1324]|uniref:zinc-binding alcohol dehydrogenase family protein n=1 Tax=Vitiosangium sp. (strain GDMCC 1.1324) TaxID=2138576 RepID=UPI000D39B66A|nr:zinc-binding alcohol dehydrogenase family protein [Vitiosangium sp. GDMCC 1.1324]PTL77258.1 zinc-binding alcohol dehydrogenase family protein [Vitiosangium sp. GDMCC 1.1324]
MAPTTQRALIVSPSDTNRFESVEREVPTPGPYDLLVEVKAVSVNPVDTKVRAKRPGRVLGWDASGVVVARGPEVKRFRVGDEVFYAGDITREGTNASLHLVDERIAGHKPRKLDHLHAASIPLTALTAWEGLYEQLDVKEGGTLLVIGAAGGVGSLAVQMAKRVSKMTVIGTASRDNTREWVEKMGADHVVNHRENLPAQLAALGLKNVDSIFCCVGTDAHFEAMAELIAPHGRIVSIVEPEQPLPMGKLFSKRARFSWEFMFSKSMYKTPDLSSQQTILDRVADLLDEGVLTSTLTVDAGALEPNALAEAHRTVASGRMVGKLAFRL